MRWKLSTLACVVVGALGVAAPATVATQTHCPRDRLRLLKADKVSQVYEGEILSNNEEDGLPAVFGCTYAQRHSYRLGELPPSPDVRTVAGGISKFVLAGPTVAFQEEKVRSVETVEGAQLQALIVQVRVVVRDLRNGHIVHRVPTGTAAHMEPGEVGIGSVKSMVAKRDGSVAWIAGDPTRSPELLQGKELYDVEAADRNGARLVASAFTIAPGSLRLHGSTLSWLEAGVRRTATLY